MIAKIENLTKKYKDVVAIDNINLEIRNKQIFALLGLNGAGKTTLIKMLTCLITPTSGNAYVLGHSILTESNKIKQIINISPQENAIAYNLTVKENLIFIGEIYGLTKKQALAKAQEMINLFDLSAKANVLSKRLSGGFQRRLGVAMALISEPKILFLDEPTLGLDILARRNLWDIIRVISKTTTIILTTHYLEEVENLADNVAILNNGKIIANDTVENLIKATDSTKFEDAFVKLTEKE